MRRLLGIGLGLALLAGCAREQPGELSSEDSRQLNEAAAMLDDAEAVPVAEDAAANHVEETTIVDPVAEE